MGDSNTERPKDKNTVPDTFNQEIGENDIKQDVCLMGGTGSIR